MKKINILLFFIATALFFNTVKIYAQGNTCATATPFCTAVGTPFSYPNDASGSTGQAGPSYGCLCTEPNPGWFYIKSLSAGTMSFNISQSNGDVDFVAWGPFTAANFGTACSNLNGACQGGCGTTVNPPCSGGIADCSYSINATENMTLNATAAGQYYLVMITNYQGSAGTITLTETSGPSSDCSISCPVLSVVGSQAVCSGAAVSATTFSTSLAPTTLTWTNSNTNIGLAASGSGNIAAYTAPVVATQQVGVITVTATKAGCTNSVQTFTITINPKPTVSSAPGAQAVCSGAAVSAEAFTSTPAGGTFAWTNSNTNIGIAAAGAGNIAGYVAPVVATQQVGTISVTPTLNGCAGTAGTFNITINPKPTVSSAPGAQAVCSGAAVSAEAFTSTPAGGTFAWTNSNTNIGIAAAGAGNIAGYVAPVVATQQVGTISVTPTLNGCAGTAGTFNITINPKPTVSSAPGAQAVCSGAAVAAEAFTSTPAGGTFAWTNSNTNIGIAAAGAGNIAGYVAPVVATQQVGTISVTPTLNGCAGTAGTFNITINPKPTVSSAPGAQAVCSGAAVSAEAFTSTPAGGTFAWTNSNTNIGIAAAGAGNIAGYTAPVVATQQVGTISVTPTLNGCAGTPGTFNITINPIPTVSSAPGAQAVCSGAAVVAEAFTSTPAGGTFTWTNSNTNIGIAAAGAGNIAGYTAPVVATQQVGTISVTPTLNGCAGTAGTFNITINPKPTVSSAPGAQAVCSGAAVSAEAFTSTPAGGTFAWTNSNTNIGIAAAGAGNIAGYTAPVVATQQVGTISVTPTLNGCAGTAGTFNITINPKPTVSSAPGAQAVCSGAAVSAEAFTSTPAGGTFAWTNSNTNIGIAAAGAGNIAGYTAPVVATQQVGTISVTPTLNGCAGTPGTFNITINPIPTVSSAPGAQAVCSGAAVSAEAFTSTPAGGTFAWTNSNTNIGIAAAGAGNIAGYTAPVVATQQVGTISVTPTLNGCTGTPGSFNITINPQPTFSLTGNAYTICNGGSQTFTVSGASTYTWTPVATLTGANTANPTASPTTTTVYSVTGTSALGCGNLTPATVTVNVTAVPSMVLKANSYTICNGGSQTFTVSGVSTYTWSPAATLNNANIANPTANPTTTTVYTVNGTASGCAQSAPLTLTLTVNPLPTYTLASNSYTICNGSSQTFTVSGASTYTWTPAATLVGANTANPTASPTTTTVYSVTGTSASNCSNLTPATVTVNVNPMPTYSLTSNVYTICNGGSQTFSVSGASTYTWTPAATLTGANTATPTASPTTTTVYSVTGTSVLGCGNLTPATVTVNVTAVPSMSLAASSYTICNGASQTFTVSGASSYTWTPAATLTGASTANPTATPTTTTTTIYTVNGTASGCASSPPLTVTLTVNPLPTYSLTANSYTICNSASQGLSVSGASTYTWTPAASLTGANTANPTASPTTTTVYSVTGTSASACSNLIPATVTVTVNPLPTYSLSGNVYTICNGGSQTFSVSGASTYTWTPAATLTGANTANPTASPTTTTVYSVTGTNANACTNLTPATVTVNVTAIPSMSLTANSYTICNGASQTFTVSGVSSYTWTPSATLDNANIASPTANPTTTTVYTVNGVASGCAPSPALTVTLTVNPLPTYSLASSSYTICSGASQGLSISGASSYTWTPAATLDNGNIATPTASPTTTTVYSVTGTDVNACSNLIPATVTVNVNPLPTYSLSGNVYTICNGGSQTFSVSGASSYTWTPSATLDNGNIANPTASPTTTTVYSVTGTDANACTNLTPATITVNVTTVPSMSLAASSYTICNGTSQTFTASGVSTYTWSPSATLDNANIASPTANPTTTTVYTVNGTASGCAQSAPLTVTLTVNPTPTITINSLGSNSVICNGASVVITPTVNPSSSASYTLNPGNQIGTSFTVSPTSSITYTINATDGTTGCPNAAADAAVVPITVNPTPTITINSLGSNSVICNGASVVITPTVNPSSSASYTLNPGNQIGTSFTVSPTSSITYTINATDGTTGCSNAATDAAIVPITVNPTPTITINSLGSNSVICNGASVVITPTVNPSSSASYTLNPGNQIGTSFTVSPTSSITYTINATDGTTGCSNAAADAAIVPITVNPTPTITINSLGSNSVICNGASVVITPTVNPSSSASYTLNPGNQIGTSFTVSPSSSITYTINATDGTTGCPNAAADAAIVPITVNPTPTITINPLGSNSVVCSGTPVIITPNGATTYTLNPGNQVGTSFTVIPMSSTTYTINGSNGSTSCTNATANAALAPIMVNQTPTLSVSSATVAAANCGLTTGGVTGINNSNVSGGAVPYSYQWTNVGTGLVVSTTSTLSNQGLGTYSLLVTDANGCVANVTGGSSTFTVPASAAIQAGMANSNPTTGTVPLAVSFTNTSVGATNYNWSFGDGDTSTAVNPANTYTSAGTYTVILVASMSGTTCSDTYTITVVVNVPTTLIVPNVFSPNGDGTNDEFFIPNTGMASLNCDIFNRWGQLLYTITAPDQGWDGITPNGDKAPEGTYMYMLVAKGLDGKDYKQQGTVMLVR